MLRYRCGEFGFRHFALGAALTGVSALAIIVVSSAHAQVRKAIEVPQTWLERNCLDKGRGDLPLHGAEFEACVRKQASALPALDPKRREWFGEQYDPAKYVACRIRPGNRTNSACDIHILRRREWPEYWPEGAKRVRWPDPPKESVYRRGMKPKEYWEALCKAEAGEFVYRAVKDVEGFLLVRPRGAETDSAMRDKYVIEDAYGLLEFGYHNREKRPGTHFLGRSSPSYRYVESGIADAAGGRTWIRHEADLTRLRDLRANRPNDSWGEQQFSNLSQVQDIKSRYGVTWRGMPVERGIETGVSGGELVVFDLSSGEPLALRRGYALDPFAARGTLERRNWLGSGGCPIMNREFQTLTAFVKRVLIPRDI